MTVMQLAAAEHVEVGDMLAGFTDAEIKELMGKHSVGTEMQAQILKEVSAIRQAEEQIASGHQLERRGHLKSALVKYLTAQIHFQGSRTSLTDRIAVIKVGLVATPEVPWPAALGTVSFCFSYASNGASRVEEAKKELEARGHRVFYGKDVSAQVDADWRKQWCIECNAAQFCVNFLSAAYIRSDSRAQEWSFCSRNKAASSIINVVVGGRDAREKLMAVLLDEVADKGGMNIRLHFETGGQTVSVYEADDIAEVILAQTVPKVPPSRTSTGEPAQDQNAEIMTVMQLAAAEHVEVGDMLAGFTDAEMNVSLLGRKVGRRRVSCKQAFAIISAVIAGFIFVFVAAMMGELPWQCGHHAEWTRVGCVCVRGYTGERCDLSPCDHACQRKALLAFKASGNGEGLNGKGWDNTNPCHGWAGVTCSNGDVTALDLSAQNPFTKGDSGLTGDVGELAPLTQLISLDLGRTDVSGSVEPLQALTKLTHLGLFRTDVSGYVKSRQEHPACPLRLANGKICKCFSQDENNCS